MGAVVVWESWAYALFCMRNGPSNRKAFLWFRRAREQRKTIFYDRGFGESALNLELRFWAGQSLWFELKSEVGLAVFAALLKAGIEIPYPQRDLHVRALDSPVKRELSSALEADGAKKMTAAM